MQLLPSINIHYHHHETRLPLFLKYIAVRLCRSMETETTIGK